ncbi:MAG: phosphatidylserine decarboxylase family protein [Sphingobacteriales bacterium]|jgi:phosphatidylserine decarboxylase|nr:phosphatidylserine decarboxylase family protein [Sphingobacteriales bacterium]
MTLHKEGTASIILALLFGALVNFSTYYFAPNSTWLHVFGIILSAFILIVILQFFRKPLFDITPNDSILLAPADGKVVVIEEVEEPEFFKDKRIQVSIFMSPINVHINRNPVSGTVKYAKYHPGLYLVAWHPKSSTENERTTVVYERANGMQLLMRQVAGALARRIVYYVKEGDQVTQGGEMGFIKFGSRVDLYLPLGTKIDVKLNDVVKGGKTSIATLS